MIHSDFQLHKTSRSSITSEERVFCITQNLFWFANHAAMPRRNLRNLVVCRTVRSVDPVANVRYRPLRTRTVGDFFVPFQTILSTIIIGLGVFRTVSLQPP